MTKQELIQEILNGQFSNADLHGLFDAVRTKQKMDRQVSAALTRAALSPGDQVQIGRIRPQYLIGAIGSIVSIAQTRAKVHLPDTLVGAYAGQTVGIPLSCLTKV